MKIQPEDAEFVADLMTSDPVMVHTTDPAGRARDLLATLGFHALPVVESGEVVGIVTTTDLADNWHDDTPILRLMSASPYTIRSGALVEEAAAEMVDRQVHHLVVQGPGETPGILSSLDLLRVLAARLPSR